MTIKGKNFKVIFRRGKPLTKVVLIAMITLCTVALVVIWSKIDKEKDRLKRAEDVAVEQKLDNDELQDKIDSLGSQDSIVDIAGDELGLYPDGTVIVETE